MKVKKLLFVIVLATIHSYGFGQCANSANIYSFNYNGKTYEIIRENKTWINAATCAVARGGMLIEINDLAEQNAIYTELNNNASIITSNTVAPDGGGASYVWIGGNDIATEGTWIWDGDNDANGNQFWMGTASGSPVGGLYNNWGNEPDNFGSGQDGLGLALTNWPLGTAGQWNDVAHSNTLYYVVEHPSIVGVENLELDNEIKLYPNPTNGKITVEGENISNIEVMNVAGKKVMDAKSVKQQSNIDLSNQIKGTYIVKITTNKGIIVKKVVFE